MTCRTLVIDNGAATLKVGYAGTDRPSKVLPNHISRVKGVPQPLIADEIDNCDDVQGLSFRRPFDRGYLVNWEVQKEIWDYAFRALKVKPSGCSLLLTEPVFNLPSIQSTTDEIVFEEYQFASFFPTLGPQLSHLLQAKEDPGSNVARSGCSLVVDCGFSFTHAVPIDGGRAVHSAVRRINIGGKGLTNYLKELVSYRAWDMMNETYIMEDIKERLCLCSLDVVRDLTVARYPSSPSNFFRCEYVLPDGVRHRRGFVKDPKAAEVALLRGARGGAWAGEAPPAKSSSTGSSAEEKPAGGSNLGLAPPGEGGSVVQASGRGGEEGWPPGRQGGGEEALGGRKRPPPQQQQQQQQELVLTNERFMVPEMLFHPADLGVNQAGLAECILRSVEACPPELHPILYSSIVLTGGSTQFPFFRQRLQEELRALVPCEYDVHVYTPKSPILSAWRGGSFFAGSPEHAAGCITKADYLEYGAYSCRRRSKILSQNTAA